MKCTVSTTYSPHGLSELKGIFLSQPCWLSLHKCPPSSNATPIAVGQNRAGSGASHHGSQLD